MKNDTLPKVGLVIPIDRQHRDTIPESEIHMMIGVDTGDVEVMIDPHIRRDTILMLGRGHPQDHMIMQEGMIEGHLISEEEGTIGTPLQGKTITEIDTDHQKSIGTLHHLPGIMTEIGTLRPEVARTQTHHTIVPHQ